MFWKRKRSWRDFSEEIRAHLQLEADELKADGQTDTEARSAALRTFGNITLAQERLYERGRTLWLDDLFRDIRYALRTMRRSPVFTVGTAILLALGIGANTAIYSFAEAILLRSLPVQDPRSLVLLKWRSPDNPPVKHSQDGESHREAALGYVSGNFPYPAFELLRSDNGVLSSTFGFFGGGDITVSTSGSAEVASSLFVSGEFFSGLGIPPAVGRTIDRQDDRAGGSAVAVLSHAYWKARFGENSNAIGQTILINNTPFQVIGVAANGFFGVDPGKDVRIYLPIRFYEATRSQFVGNSNSMYRDDHWYWIQIMGRLRPGVTRQQAEAALSAAFSAWVASTASSEKEKTILPTLYLQDGASGLDLVRYYFSKPLFLLMTMAGLILALACANVANLLLARAAARRREIALRLGLGAGRLRMARQLLTESLLLSILGGAFGVFVAWAGMRGLSTLVSTWEQDTTFRAEMNWSFLLVSAGLAAITGLLFGLAPAIQAGRVQPGPGLKEAQHGGPAGWFVRVFPGGVLKNGLVTVQIAISLLLLAGASLFVRTVSNLQSVRLGFNPDHLLLFDVDARQAGYEGETMARFYTGATNRLRLMPGVQAATLASYALVAGSRSGTSVSVPGDPSTAKLGTAVIWVGPNFLNTMQIPLVLGRDISEKDSRSGPMAVVVNEAFVAKHFPDRSAIGQTLQFADPENASATIVGVARNTPLYSLKEETEPVVYGSYLQHLARISKMTFLLRTGGGSFPIAGAAQRVIASVDARVPITNVRTQIMQIQRTIGQERLFAFLCSTFAILALVIASVGLYGTLAYGVLRRTGEIGIRMALGARRRQVVLMILRESLPMVTVGLLIGLSLVWASSRLIESFLFGMTPADPAALSRAVITLVTSATIAGLLPAWRASRVDPMVSLRYE